MIGQPYEIENESIEFQGRLISFLSGMVLISPCLSYAILGDAPLIPLLAIVFLTLSILKKYPIPITVRALVYSLTLSFLFTAILNLTYPVDGDRFFSPLPTEILFPFLISLGICGTYFPQSPRILTTILTLSILAMMLQGSSVNDPTNERLVVTSTLWQNRFWVFGFFLILQMSGFIPLIYLAQEQRSSAHLRKGKQRARVALYCVSLVLLVSMIGISCRLVAKVEQIMDPVFSSIFSTYLSSFKSKVVFGSETDLYRKVDSQIQKNKNRIVLRAKSSIPPGYLRGRVYSRYVDGKWKENKKEVLTGLPVTTSDGLSTVSRFYRGKKEAKIKDSTDSRIDIIPSRFFYSDVLLTTGNTQIVEIIADRLESNPNGVLFPKSWDRDGAYTIFKNKDQQEIAYQNPDLGSEWLDSYLEISDDKLKGELNRIAAKILGDSSKDSIKKIRKIEHNLNTNFNYSLNTTMDGDLDPVIQFLVKKKSGHCEFFATAAALLLRSQGIATRYVTGFVSVEPHPKTNHWIARLGDCHAWVEAWISEKQSWVLVEPTPPEGIPQTTLKTGKIYELKESLILFWKSIYAQVKRGYFGEAVIRVALAAVRFFVWLFWTGPWYFGWGILFLSVLIFLPLLSKKLKQRTEWKQAYLSDCNLIYLEIESYLKKLNIRRSKTMSIPDLIHLIDKKNNPRLSEITSILSEYEFLRFCPSYLNMDRIRHLKARLNKWK